MRPAETQQSAASVARVSSLRKRARERRAPGGPAPPPQAREGRPEAARASGALWGLEGRGASAPQPIPLLVQPHSHSYCPANVLQRRTRRFFRFALRPQHRASRRRSGACPSARTHSRQSGPGTRTPRTSAPSCAQPRALPPAGHMLRRPRPPHSRAVSGDACPKSTRRTLRPASLALGPGAPRLKTRRVAPQAVQRTALLLTRRRLGGPQRRP